MPTHCTPWCQHTEAVAAAAAATRRQKHVAHHEEAWDCQTAAVKLLDAAVWPPLVVPMNPVTASFQSALYLYDLHSFNLHFNASFASKMFRLHFTTLSYLHAAIFYHD